MSVKDRSFDLLLFDLDGVITTEYIYWECARLTLWELLHVRLQASHPYVHAVHDLAAREQMLPQDLIYSIKNRAINSNWDLTFVAGCAMLAALGEGTSPGAQTVDELVRLLRRGSASPIRWPDVVASLLARAPTLRGGDLLDFAGEIASTALGMPFGFFRPDGEFWQYAYDRFQLWYEGTLMGLWGARPLEERPVLPLPEVQEALGALRDRGYILGIATGRPLGEAERALRAFNVLEAFDPSRMVTYTDVVEAQDLAGISGLGKPHPFIVRRALAPEAALEEHLNGLREQDVHKALMIGDSSSDALAASGAGIPCLGVLSGVSGETARKERREALLSAGCLDVIDDIAALPDWLAGQ